MAITNDNFCLTVMRELKELVGTNGDPLQNRQRAGLLDALLSDENTTGNEITPIMASAGKNNKLILKHLAPDAEADVADTIANFCEESGSSTTYRYDEVSLTLQAQSPVKSLTEAEMRDLCEDGNTFRTKIIAGAMNALVMNIEKQLIPVFYTGVGGILNGNGAVGTEYQMLWRDGQLTTDAEGEIKMFRDLMNTGFAGRPQIVGGSGFDTWAKLKQIACCNQYGIDNSNQGDFSYYYSQNLDTVLSSPSNDNPFFVFMPRSAQFVSHPNFVGEFRKVSDTFIKDTITDPITGLEFDFHLSYDPCGNDNNGAYKWMMSLNFGLWQMPLDLFKSNDDRYKINGNFAFQATEGTPA